MLRRYAPRNDENYPIPDQLQTRVLDRQVTPCSWNLRASSRLLRRRIAAPAPASFTYNDFADLHDRRDIGVVLNITHDLLRMRPETGLEGFDGVGEDVTHANIGRGSAGCSASKTFVDGVVLASVAHTRFYQRHVLVPVIVVIEARTGVVGIHNTDLDHGFLLFDVREIFSGETCEPPYSPISFNHSSSVSTGTPCFLASASFEPAPGPAMR